ncbi:uncharacterized protein LOC135206196 isoform X2 [Macrobrachium nipponense]|uniref:uncharacterized protein LOC135206196 isoform X2 n=1 Tax=Macrobrachium nipponense TaxID=159736 RepID=UPI0030C7CE4F
MSSRSLKQISSQVSEIDAESGEFRTYSYLRENVPRVAGGLRSSGVCPGDVVVFLSPNHIDYQLLLLSVMYCGASFAPVNPDLTSGELSHMIQKSCARWAICHPSKLDNFQKAVGLLPGNTIRKTWILEQRSENSIYNLMDSPPANPVTIENGLDFKKSVALILFSSGTTGFPKGVLLSHENLLLSHAINRYLQALMTPEEAARGKQINERPLLMMPMCHLFGFVISMGVLAPGCTVILLKRFTPNTFFQAIEKHKVTICHLVPHLVNFLSKTPLYDQYDTSSVLGFTSATAPLGKETANAFIKRTGRILGSGYGLTETGGITGNGGALGFKAGSVGRIMPYVRIKVLNVTTGEMLGDNEEGEICINSPGNMVGYANDLKATKGMIDDEGWVHTGDIGYFDKDNFLYITDRMKDLIKVKGFQVSPSELELVLLGHDGVSEVAVIGVPHDRTGEAPRAYVVPAPGAHLDAKQLQEYVRDRVVPYKQMTGGIVFVDSLPRNLTGKLLRKKLKEEFTKTKSKL